MNTYINLLFTLAVSPPPFKQSWTFSNLTYVLETTMAMIQFQHCCLEKRASQLFQ